MPGRVKHGMGGRGCGWLGGSTSGSICGSEQQASTAKTGGGQG